MISHSLNKDNIGYDNMYYIVIVSNDILFKYRSRISQVSISSPLNCGWLIYIASSPNTSFHNTGHQSFAH